MQSKELTKFYQVYSDWLDAGAPDKKPIWRSFGLCSATADISYGGVNSWKVCHELVQQFINAGLVKQHPFNSSIKDYIDESHKQINHLNPARIA